MIDRADFIGRIAAAVFAGRRKLPPTVRRWHGDHYERVAAKLYAVDAARKLPWLWPHIQRDELLGSEIKAKAVF